MRYSLITTLLSLWLLTGPSLLAAPLANETLMLSLKVAETQVKIDFSVVKPVPYEQPGNSETGSHLATLLDKDNKALFTLHYSDPLRVYDTQKLDSTQHILAIPNLSQARSIRFERNDPATGGLTSLGTEPLPKPTQ